VDDSTESEWLQHQVAAAARVAPIGNIAHAATFLAVGLLVIPHSVGFARFAWMAAGVLTCLYTVLAWLPASRVTPFPHPLRVRTQMMCVSALFGSLWVWGYLLVVSQAPGQSAVVVAATIAGVMGCGAVALSTCLRVAMTWVITIGLGDALATFLQPSRELKVLGAFCVGYILALGVCIAYLNRSFEARWKAEHATEVAHRRVSLLLEEFEGGSRDWIWETTPDGVLERASARFVDVSGLPASELHRLTLPGLLKRLSAIGAPGTRGAVISVAALMSAHRPFAALELSVIVARETRWWRLSGHPQPGGGWSGVGSDITAQREAQERVQLAAITDSLTGVPNRYAFNAVLEGSGEQLRMESSTRLWLAIIDLDDFKSVNDSLGHPLGDRLLQAVAQRIAAAMSSRGFFARLGGDEFGVLLSGVTEDEAKTQFDRLGGVVADAPFDIDGRSVSVTCGIGYAAHDQLGDRQELADLVIAADLALYEAKYAGRNRLVRFRPEFRSDSDQRITSMRELSAAVADDELIAHFQPQVSIDQQQVVGVEALCRWVRPSGEIIPPSQFIRLAEQSGDILPLGRRMLQLACMEAASWSHPIRVSVNVSPVQLLAHGFVADVVTALEAAKLPAGRLTLEVTESSLVDQDAMAVLADIRDQGVRVSLDDFGTGYASLSNLRAMPLDEIKIDRSFVTPLDQGDPVAMMVVRSVIDLAEALELTVVAEGVETEHQHRVLEELGCTVFQGYLNSRPLSPTELADHLRRVATTRRVRPRDRAPG
jgi:diguanylate cyclase (GGDEF)-like protein